MSTGTAGRVKGKTDAEVRTARIAGDTMKGIAMEATKCYAIWEVDGKRIPLLHGRRKSIVFTSPDEAQKALERRGRRHPTNTRGLIYTIPNEGSAFDREPVRTVAL